MGQPFIAKDPRGKVLLISPKNYPLRLIVRPLASAIAAGNVVVIKPLDDTLKTAEVLEAVIERNFEKVAVSAFWPQLDVEPLSTRFGHLTLNDLELHQRCPRRFRGAEGATERALRLHLLYRFARSAGLS